MARWKQIDRVSTDGPQAREALHAKAAEGRPWGAGKSVPGNFAKMAAMRAEELKKAKLSGVAGGKQAIQQKEKKKNSAYRKMIKDIRSIQAREDLLMPRQNFRMMIREIGQELKPTLRMKPEAIEALQHMFEGYMTGVFGDVAVATIHGKRKTSKVVDLNIVKHIRSKSGQPWLVGAEEIL
jgi:histone H3/H4